MRHTEQTSGGPAPDSSDKTVWEYCRATAAEIDETELFLDLAGFADARLDADERERVAALLAADPEAASDVAAAQTLATDPIRLSAEPEIIARAAALVDEPARGVVIPFSRGARPSIVNAARWGGLAAAVAFASWLGFALGSDASRAFGQIAQTQDDGVLSEMLDPAGSVLRNITDGPES
jgi:anti-sigma factor RsiW